MRQDNALLRVASERVATYDPLDAELECEDDDMSDAEREARLHDEHYGCYGEDA